jgi:antirestriction protein ArdC
MDKKNNFKPLSEHIAGQMVQDLENGSSIFQRPWKEDGPFIPPFNAVSGKTYAGVPALILAMKDMEDPRWVTKKQARFNDLTLEQNPKGTVISFPKNSELKPVLDERGDKIPGDDGRAQMESVKLDKTFYVMAVLYNGKQVENLPDLKETLDKRNELQPLSPVERTQQIIEHSKVLIQKSGDAQRYDPRTDTILMPDKNEFASEASYYAAVMREMTQWAGAEDRVSRPLESEVQANSRVRDDLRANIAALMISAELNLGYEPVKDNQVKAWAQLLKDDPKELFKAAGEAQWLSKYILGFEKAQEIKEEVKDEIKSEVKEEIKDGVEQGTAPAKTNPNKLAIGDIIPYNDTYYHVLETLKNGKVEMAIESTGTHVKAAPKDNLYKSLLEARDNPREMVEGRETDIDEQEGQEIAENEEFSYSR